MSPTSDEYRRDRRWFFVAWSGRDFEKKTEILEPFVEKTPATFGIYKIKRSIVVTMASFIVSRLILPGFLPNSTNT